MKIFDCFTFNDELEILDIRLNILNKFVDKFIIVESKTNHQGNEKKVNFNINQFKKFKDKINYFLIDKIPSNYSSWEIEGYQRNYISYGLNSCDKNDVIIISDIDEIPNLEKFNFNKMKRKFYSFEQEHFMYKLNLERPVKWIGSKLCKYKNLKSPQWLRSLKTHKKYSVWRIDKIFNKNYSFDFDIIRNTYASANNATFRLYNLAPHTRDRIFQDRYNIFRHVKTRKDINFNLSYMCVL